MLLLNPFWHAATNFLVDAADFDGSNDYLTRGGELTGVVASKIFTFVVWFRYDAGQTSYIFKCADSAGSVASRFAVVMQTATGAGDIQITGHSSALVERLNISTNDAVLSTGTWYCLMVSVDLADTAKRHLYLGDTNRLDTVTTYANSDIGFTGGGGTRDWVVGARGDGANKFDGGLAELMFWEGAYIDFSQSANRRLFYSASGKPVNPNAPGGAIATLGTPDVYLELSDGEAAANFATNDGGGGNFTVNGSLSTYASSPSD